MPVPRVYIIVLTWNQKNDTLECLDSLQRLEYTNYRLLLVDNASTDDTVKGVAARFPHVQIIENSKNLGYAAGNNVGIRYASKYGADYILLLNNDTVVAPDALTHLVATAQANPDVAAISAKILLYSQPNIIWFVGAKWSAKRAVFVPVRSGETDDFDDRASETDYACGCALFLRTEAATKVGFFDSQFFLTWEEIDWCYRARRQGYRIMVEPRAKVWHKVSRSIGEPGTSPMYNYYYARNRWLWIAKNLDGQERLRAFQRYLRETYWVAASLTKSDLSQSEKAIAKAKLLGGLHYLIRRFGECPPFSRS